jgi:hypothetical protein
MWPGGGSRPTAENAKKGETPTSITVSLALSRFGIRHLSAPEIRECDEMCLGKSEIHVDSCYTTLSLCVFW